MEEVEEVVETRQRILTEEDAKLAHYAAWMISPHAGKKTPRPEKLRRIPDEAKEQATTSQDNVISIEERRRRNQELAASLANRKDRIVRRRSG